MTESSPRYLVTGASGQLGRRVIEGLLATVPAPRVAALVRNAKAAPPLEALGVAVHFADYDQPEALAAAFAGIDRLLLVSSSEVGRRVEQHRNVIAAARRAGVGFLAYTSLLRADTSPLALAAEHVATEALLRESGLPHALLRNGWYTENVTASLPAALEHGVHLGSAGEGRFSAAARRDYADAAVAVLTDAARQAGRVHELAGDAAFTLAEFAAEAARLSGRPVAYRDLPQAEYQAALVGFGLPEPFAALLADSDAGAARGALFDDGKQLSALIGRPTTPYGETIAATLRG